MARALINNIKKPEKIALIGDTKVSGTGGQQFSSGAWRIRDINLLEGDTSFISMPVDFELATYDFSGATPDATKQEFTLVAGTYTFMGSCASYYVNGHRARLYNVTDSTITLRGNNAYEGSSNGSAAVINGTFTIATSKTFRVEHRCQTTHAFGGGIARSWAGEEEIYMGFVITKVE